MERHGPRRIAALHQHALKPPDIASSLHALSGHVLNVSAHFVLASLGHYATLARFTHTRTRTSYIAFVGASAAMMLRATMHMTISSSMRSEIFTFSSYVSFRSMGTCLAST